MQFTITTRYESRWNSNVGKVVARCQGRQKASTWDQALGSDENHQAAADRMLHVLIGVLADGATLTQRASNDSGTERTFVTEVTA